MTNQVKVQADADEITANMKLQRATGSQNGANATLKRADEAFETAKKADDAKSDVSTKALLAIASDRQAEAKTAVSTADASVEVATLLRDVRVADRTAKTLAWELAKQTLTEAKKAANAAETKAKEAKHAAAIAAAEQPLRNAIERLQKGQPKQPPAPALADKVAEKPVFVPPMAQPPITWTLHLTDDKKTLIATSSDGKSTVVYDITNRRDVRKEEK
jgi:hypothetical protein